MSNNVMAYSREFKVTRGIKDIYRLYKEDKISKNEEYLKYTEFANIMYAANKAVSLAVIEKGLHLKLGYKLGYLRIRKTKMRFTIKNNRLIPKRQSIDWGASRKLWYRLYPGKTLNELKEIKGKPKIYYINEHTNGEVMRWYWDKTTCRVPNKKAYLFHPVKQNRLNLIKQINEGKYDQFEF